MVVPYNPALAVEYAIQFGYQAQNGIFKRMSEDCTNFISQCIWAGYGGTEGYSLTNEADILALRERVAKNYRQTSIWYGRNYASSAPLASMAFIRVEELWNYVTTNQGNGPRAIGYNNRQYWGYAPVDLALGDVLQFYHSNLGRYGHTVMVTSTSENPQPIESALGNVYVAQHTADYSFRPFGDVLETNGGIEGAWMRVLKFTDANF
ncbi:MAG TPA: hypothetical protein DHW61_18325 [Lachnoclostridium phytofermentans]|uniref:Putative amidase domain-containing protein n=1 Tax=Lachnoclostridium phytofermentans TaxID=66219 RepID=A0A3D2XCU6_9FIRM|nr:amidase domain-containing protein [Lachnoclostridium sp.]HCL04335.1 hypothetical protein [Lachnoclostridium phytofermentans]